MSLLIKRVAAYFCIMPLPPAPALRLSPSQHQELMKITNHPSTPQAIVLRCRVVLGAAKGIANNELARQLSTSLPTVLLWRRRFQHPRYHIHFTPTGSSWLNQMERWFAEITAKRIRRGTFRSVKELTRAIESYIRDSQQKSESFRLDSYGTFYPARGQEL